MFQTTNQPSCRPSKSRFTRSTICIASFIADLSVKMVIFHSSSLNHENGDSHQLMHIHGYFFEQRTRLFVKFNAMHKLGSSPIGCEDFGARYHKWGKGIGSSPIGCEGFVQPQKGHCEAKLNQYYNNFVGSSYNVIYTSQ